MKAAFAEDAAGALQAYLAEHQVPPLVRNLVESEIRVLRAQVEMSSERGRARFIEIARVRSAIMKRILECSPGDGSAAMQYLADDLGIELQEEHAPEAE